MDTDKTEITYLHQLFILIDSIIFEDLVFSLGLLFLLLVGNNEHRMLLVPLTLCRVIYQRKCGFPWPFIHPSQALRGPAALDFLIMMLINGLCIILGVILGIKVNVRL
jgi:hypothetical protein